MFDNIRKSLSSTLYERTSSPFYGTLIISWVLWNWRIIYLTFFISENKIDEDKISYISENFSSIHNLVTFPLISTLIILTLIPFISNGAYWLNLNFEKWKKEQKIQIEKKQLLTLEQSLEIREQLVNQESRFEKLLNDKNNEIKQLNSIIERSNNNKPIGKKSIQENIGQSINLDEVAKKIKNVDKDLVVFEKILAFIQSGYKMTDRSDIPSKLITILEVNDIISPKGNGIYNLTENGKRLTRQLIQ